MKLIIGLGNPGPAYAKTRHSIGRRIVGEIARRSHLKWKSSRTLESQSAELEHLGVPAILALPAVFMNESGKSVKRLIRRFRIEFEQDLLVVVDDAALPFGRLRLRARGSDGGHRGLLSIQEALGSPSYARLRIGIAPLEPVEEALEEYVLSPFSAKEEAKLKGVIDRAVAASLAWISEPIERVMDRANPPPDSV